MGRRRGLFLSFAVALACGGAFAPAGAPAAAAAAAAAAAGSSTLGDLSVRELAKRLSVTADEETLSKWQTEVDKAVADFQAEQRRGYPCMPTRQSLHSSAFFSLQEFPGEEFQFLKALSPQLYELQANSKHAKHVVDADVFFREAKVVEDPLKDANGMVERVELLLSRLKAVGPKLRADVDAMAAKSAKTLEFLKQGVAAEDLQLLESFESKAAAELEAAKKVRTLFPLLLLFAAPRAPAAAAAAAGAAAAERLSSAAAEAPQRPPRRARVPS
ncbi:hypothetical protein ETH_00024930 [Eimeria tenella]|uniref:Uncharacterized protein n=1 Tax=Eimeria tenella TaxID=5802 RepID=U6KQG6_EIMTE|nr:hypothetical protein ETH_00024930 [Eimeria tenella]CDJ38517.1 hypothetical protein ETH_00024930 [Eimeria tenella]|eukprot:XP_013229355.1 hypothetical protein ETH_00024930 [Eimeria tenella]